MSVRGIESEQGVISIEPEYLLKILEQVDLAIDQRFPPGEKNKAIFQQYIAQVPNELTKAIDLTARKNYATLSKNNKNDMSWETIRARDTEQYRLCIQQATPRILSYNLENIQLSRYLKQFMPTNDQESRREQDCIAVCGSFIDELRKKLNEKSPRSVKLLQIINEENETATEDEKIIYCALEFYCSISALHETLSKKPMSKVDVENFVVAMGIAIENYAAKAQYSLEQLANLLNNNDLLSLNIYPRQARRSLSFPDRLNSVMIQEEPFVPSTPGTKKKSRSLIHLFKKFNLAGSSSQTEKIKSPQQSVTKSGDSKGNVASSKP